MVFLDQVIGQFKCLHHSVMGNKRVALHDKSFVDQEDMHAHVRIPLQALYSSGRVAHVGGGGGGGGGGGKTL